MLEFNSEQKEYTTTTLLNDENKRFELKTVCQFYQEQIEQCKVLCKQKIRNSFLNPVFSIYTKYFIVPSITGFKSFTVIEFSTPNKMSNHTLPHQNSVI